MPTRGITSTIQVFKIRGSPIALIEFRFKPSTISRAKHWPVVKKNEVFAPLSPTQAKKLGRFLRSEQGRGGLGYARGIVDHEARIVRLNELYPFRKQAPTHSAARSGINLRLHHAIATAITRRFKGYRIGGEGDVSPSLKRYFRRLGIYPYKLYSPETYLRLLRDHIARRFSIKN
ncbi:hypothetical protein HY571_00450 [Candidatus Micrarchaeota archaeon]|nr:hypothetical protein [Candidatus Micrarchaeota archaeon]